MATYSTPSIMKTTAIGILTIVSALATGALDFLKTGSANWEVLVTTVIVGVGFLKAADAQKG